jgi:hypothetical protein
VGEMTAVRLVRGTSPLKSRALMTSA